MSTEKKCLQCRKTSSGRTNKKFCSNNCRNKYNNIQKLTDYHFMKPINEILGKNRKIIRLLLHDKETRTVDRNDLLVKGFNFKYFTHTYVNAKGNHFYFLYDCGYFSMEHNYLMLVMQKGEQTKFVPPSGYEE